MNRRRKILQQYIKHSNYRSFWRKFVRFLACLVVFCTTYALILPAITLETAVNTVDELSTQNRSVSLFSSVSGDNPLLTNDAKITEGVITNYTTGTAPWDANNSAGCDTTADNMIVRTFDTINYDFSVTIASISGKAYDDARVKLEFILPLKESEATFDQTAMAWMDTTEGYAPVLETKTINGVESQVLTCYKHLLPSEGNTSVIPGTFGNNVSVKVFSMKNGATVKPSFSVSMVYGDYADPSSIQTTSATSLSVDPITVTCAPSYNIQASISRGNYATVDFSTGNSLANNMNISPDTDYIMQGRLAGVGLTLQLYNTNSSKGLKGVELPDGSDITFDITVSSSYKLTNSSTTYDVSSADQYMPLLYSYGGNNDDYVQEDGRTIAGKSASGRNLVTPLNEFENKKDHELEKKYCCYDGGDWTAVQEGNVIHVTVSDYKIDPSAFPAYLNYNITDETKPTYSENIGVFSTGEFWFLQPFNKVNGTLGADRDSYQILQEYGNGSFTTTVKVTNMKMTSASGQKAWDTAGTNDSQADQTDDNCGGSMPLKISGNLINRAAYTGNDWCAEGGLDGTWEQLGDGSDTAMIGGEINIMGGFRYNPVGEEENRIVSATSLIKFDGDAITLSGEKFGYKGEVFPRDDTVGLSYHAFEAHPRYATKKDGTNWISDDEMIAAEEDDLYFYDSLDDIPEGHVCVAAFIYYVKDETPWDVFANNYMNGEPSRHYWFYTSVNGHVNEDVDLIGNVYMTTSICRVYLKSGYDSAMVSYDNIPFDWTQKEIDPGTSVVSGLSAKYEYTKESYYPDGGMVGTHSGGSEEGDSLLVTGYKVGITKNPAQTTDGITEKTVYNLDNGQRVADFVMQPTITLPTSTTISNLTTQIIITATLPKHLSYRPGSSYLGGEYSQTSPNGGTQGLITGGQMSEPSVSQNGDGTQTLTWILDDVVVGAELPTIFYSANIGTESNPETDIGTGTTTFDAVTVKISATHDVRTHSVINGNYDTVGLQAVRGMASSYGKYARQTLVDSDETIEYVLYYDNNSSQEMNGVAFLDTMPYNNDSVGSQYSGTYTITSTKLDVSKCDVSKVNVYYTTDTSYRNKVMPEITAATISSWTKATINATTGAISDFNNKSNIVAWGVVCSIPAQSSINIEMNVDLVAAAADTTSSDSNSLVNTFSTSTTTTTVNVHSVRRSLEGLVWMDYNADGIQDEEMSSRLSGVKVTLMQLKSGGDPSKASDYSEYILPDGNTVASIYTGQRLSLLSSGTFEMGTNGHYDAYGWYSSSDWGQARSESISSFSRGLTFTGCTGNNVILAGKWNSIYQDLLIEPGETYTVTAKIAIRPENTQIASDSPYRNFEMRLEPLHADTGRSKYDGEISGTDWNIYTGHDENIPAIEARFNNSNSYTYGSDTYYYSDTQFVEYSFTFNSDEYIAQYRDSILGYDGKYECRLCFVNNTPVDLGIDDVSITETDAALVSGNQIINGDFSGVDTDGDGVLERVYTAEDQLNSKYPGEIIAERPIGWRVNNAIYGNTRVWKPAVNLTNLGSNVVKNYSKDYATWWNVRNAELIQDITLESGRMYTISAKLTANVSTETAVNSTVTRTVYMLVDNKHGVASSGVPTNLDYDWVTKKDCEFEYTVTDSKGVDYYWAGDFTDHSITFSADDFAKANGIAAVDGKYKARLVFVNKLESIWAIVDDVEMLDIGADNLIVNGGGEEGNWTEETFKSSSLYQDAYLATNYEQGRYMFTDLPEGTFAVKFEDGLTKISPYIASASNIGLDSRDSDALPTYNSAQTQLVQTAIYGIEMPAVEEISVALYRSMYHDSGLYKRGYVLPQTGGSGTYLYTIAGTLLSLTAILLLYKRKRGRRLAVTPPK